jgi:hypothetical protein
MDGRILAGINMVSILHYLASMGNTHASYISLLELLRCYQSIVNHDSLPIIDLGAFVCITLHRLDFITYAASNMMIKDLSLSNTVAGEGLMHWKVEDLANHVVNLDLPGYHIPGVEVHLLSPQVLLSTFGGHTIQTMQKVEVCLENDLILHAHLCPQSCLPFVTICAQ